MTRRGGSITVSVDLDSYGLRDADEAEFVEAALNQTIMRLHLVIEEALQHLASGGDPAEVRLILETAEPDWASEEQRQDNARRFAAWDRAGRPGPFWEWKG